MGGGGKIELVKILFQATFALSALNFWNHLTYRQFLLTNIGNFSIKSNIGNIGLVLRS